MSRIEEAIEKALRMRESGAAVKERAPLDPKHSPVVPEYDDSNTLEIQCDNPYIVSLNQPNTPVAEEYRKLKSAVVGLTSRDSFLNTIMVTSTISGEGKSITALNLAITLSKDYDYTVLLVDTDLRKPTLHKYLNLEPRAGISECLMEERDLQDVLVKTNIGKLSFLPAGRRVDNPVELLSSQRMKDFLAGIKERYPDRYIIIDTPPILPFAETRAMSALVDGVIFVIKERAAALKEVQEALGLFNGNMLGVVYNGVSPEQLKSNHYYGY
ncbi:MAG: polysaccharide biosynthesis protein [Deltaproteobacteria bacterium GWA2_55_10]|nr:MAG: polysaccharide biosynthesis protein [Deltaproteobacteria bacterium GWA2_55_10]